MKKLKLLSIILCIALAMGAAACNSADTSPQLDSIAPWSAQGRHSTEIAVYDFARYYKPSEVDSAHILDGEDEEKGYTLTKSGSLTYTLREDYSLAKTVDNKWSEVSRAGFTLIKMELETQYKDDLSFAGEVIDTLYSGKWDKITSYTVINRYSLNSLFTYKTTEIGGQLNGDTLSYVLTVDYTGDFVGTRGASIVDYVTSTANGASVTSIANEKTLSIKSGDYYDGEAIYYFMRAMNSVQTSSTATFSVASPYTDYADGLKKVTTKGAQQSTAAETEKVTLPLSLLDIFNIPKADIDVTGADGEDTDTVTEETNTFSLDCYHTTFSLTTNKPGSNTNLYYSAHPVKTDNKEGRLVAATKVLAKIQYQTRDKYSLTYNQEFTLSSYSNG